MHSPAPNAARARRRGLLAHLRARARLGAADPAARLGADLQLRARALARATARPTIDAYHWETRDKSYYQRPLLLREGARARLRDAAAVRGARTRPVSRATSRGRPKRRRDHGAGRWAQGRPPATASTAASGARVPRSQATIEGSTVMVWVLGLFGAVLPALAAAAAGARGRRAGRARVRHGRGADSRPGHAGDAVRDALLLARASRRCSASRAFALLWQERRGPPRLALVAARRAARRARGDDRVPARDRGRDRRRLRASSRGDVVRRGARLRGRRRRRRAAARSLYNLWAFGSTHALLLRRRRLGPGDVGPRRARPERRRLLRHRPCRARTSRSKLLFAREGAADALAGARRWAWSGSCCCTGGAAAGGAHDRRPSPLALPRLQLRLLPAVRRRVARARGSSSRCCRSLRCRSRSRSGDSPPTTLAPRRAVSAC